MQQIIETLPKESQQTLKSTYENIIDLGIERGMERGMERGEALAHLKLALKSIYSGVETLLITNILEIPERLIKYLKINVNHQFKAKEPKLLLATELLEHFKQLEVEDIAAFCQLSHEEVAKLKDTLAMA